MRYRLPRPAIRAGVVYVTEDRKLEGFFEHMSIADNIYTNYLGAGLQAHGVVSLKETKVLAEHWTKALQVKALDSSASVIELSGGNQQEVVIAAALVKRPQLIIFDEPTRGVDVGAIADIHQLIRQLADSGMGVVVISSYLPEILNLSDRILVARNGRIVEEFSAKEANEEDIMFAAVHISHDTDCIAEVHDGAAAATRLPLPICDSRSWQSTDRIRIVVGFFMRRARLQQPAGLFGAGAETCQ